MMLRTYFGTQRHAIERPITPGPSKLGKTLAEFCLPSDDLSGEDHVSIFIRSDYMLSRVEAGAKLVASFWNECVFAFRTLQTFTVHAQQIRWRAIRT
jgi:hypothetical protein